MRSTVRVLSDGWRQIAADNVNRRIFNALLIIGSLSVVAKFVTIGKEIIIARTFGTSDSLEAFLVAISLPMYTWGVVASSFNAAFIPIYIEVRENEGPIAAHRLFSGVVILSTALLMALTAVLALIGPYLLHLIGSNFGPEKLSLARTLFFLLLPTIVISGLATFWDGVLNALERFALTSIAPITVPIVSVVFLFALGNTWGIYALAFGTIAGYLLQLCLLAWGLKKQGVSLRLRWFGIESGTRRVIGQYLPILAGSTIMGGTVIVDQSMAAMLSPGSVAVLNYGNRVVGLLNGVGTLALGTAVLPYFSKMIAANDWIGVRQSLKTYSWLILFVTVPLTLLAFVFSRPLVQVLFERGRFTDADTLLVSRVQSLYVIQVPFYCVSILFVRLISSLQANRILMWGTVISFTVNITMDFLLMRILGVAGIALSTTLVMVISCSFLSLMLYKKLKNVASR